MDDDEEEILVQEALDSSAEGLGSAGAGSSAVSANTLRTDEKEAFSLWASPRVCRPSQAAGSLDTLGRSPTGPDGLHSAPTSVQVLVPVIVPASANTLPSAAACDPASVSVQTAVLASVKTLPSGQAPGAAPGPASAPSVLSLCLDSARSPLPGEAGRLEGTAGSAGNAARPIDS